MLLKLRIKVKSPQLNQWEYAKVNDSKNLKKVLAYV